jgi:hypothetical protein
VERWRPKRKSAKNTEECMEEEESQKTVSDIKSSNSKSSLLKKWGFASCLHFLQVA